MTGPFDYSVFGLHVRSDLRLPELLAADPQSEPEVSVRFGPVPPAPGGGVQNIDDRVLMEIPEVGRYAITGGSHITVDRVPGAPDANVRLYLLGSAMGVLLHQRGLLPLHANAVEIGERAFAFMGESGAGKSTLAAWFNDRGFRVVADDVCVVSFADEGPAQVCPGIGRLRLWRDVMDATGRDIASYERSLTGADAPDKYDVPLARPSASDAAIPLAAVYLLERSEELQIERLSGVAAAEAVFANTYRGSYVPLAGSGREHWSASVQLVRNTPILRAGRRWGLDNLDEQYSKLLEHALAIGGEFWLTHLKRKDCVRRRQ